MPIRPLALTLEAAPKPTEGAVLIQSQATSPSPLVTVVVSTRNHASTLGRNVEAVMRQDLDAEIEMIVVDNASSDETPDVMRDAVEGAVGSLLGGSVRYRALVL